MDQVYDTFADLGGIYKSGMDQTVSTTELNISDGIARIRMNLQEYPNEVSSLQDFFYINSTGNFVQCVDNTCLTKYVDDTDIGNNRYYSLVWGVIPIDNNQRLMVILQGNPGSGKEYISPLKAEEDPLSQVNFFPSDSNFKGAFIPVARTIHRRTGSNDFVTFPTTSELFQDLRGKATVSSGGVPSPPITDHDMLDNLNWSIAGHIMDSDLDMNGFQLTEIGALIMEGLISSYSIVPVTNNLYSLGNSTNKFKEIFVGDVHATNINSGFANITNINTTTVNSNMVNSNIVNSTDINSVDATTTNITIGGTKIYVKDDVTYYRGVA